eukprot:747049-Hanusia_phi.AAC.2
MTGVGMQDLGMAMAGGGDLRLVPSQGKGGKKKGAKASSNVALVNNQVAAAANKPTAVRPFAVQHKANAAAPSSKSSQMSQNGKFAGGAFLNSPPPSSLPLPNMIAARPVMNPVFSDPAIITSSFQEASSHQQTSALNGRLVPGARVNAQFLDGQWYDGTVHKCEMNYCAILFDGYEHEGVYEIPMKDVRPYPSILSTPPALRDAGGDQVHVPPPLKLDAPIHLQAGAGNRFLNRGSAGILSDRPMEPFKFAGESILTTPGPSRAANDTAGVTSVEELERRLLSHGQAPAHGMNPQGEDAGERKR